MINAFLQHRHTVERQLASVGQATERISQHFTTILNQIQSTVKQLPSADSVEKREKIQQTINEEVVGILDFIKELNTFANLQKSTLQCEKNLITNQIKEALAKLETKIERLGVQVEFNASEDISILCDREKVTTVFWHLIDNALNALATQPEGQRQIKIDVSYLNSFRNAVNIIIEDTGGGICEQLLGHVFEPFTTSQPDSHNGIGGTIAKQFVDRHGGVLAYTSHPGKGTTFQVILPISPDSQIAGNVSEKIQ